MSRQRSFASLAVLALVACEAPSVAFEIEFADTAQREASAAIEIALHAGDCDSGEVLWRATLHDDEQPSDVPATLARGRAYCIEAVARDASCAVIASAVYESADAPTGVVTLMLDATAGGSDCEGVACVDGVCSEACDVEGASCVSSGEPGTCRAGACCTGCWNGEECLRGDPAVEIAGGESFACLRTDEGRIACWGSNGQGELGDGTRGGSTGPSWRADAQWIDVPEGAGAPVFRSVEAGVASGYAIDGDGALWAWGWNNRGQLGLGEAAVGVNAFSPAPVEHPLGSPWDRIVALSVHDDTTDPDLHTCGFARGELWCWGANQAGQVDPTQGMGEREAIVARPRRVEGLFTDVALAQRTTCAVQMDGSVACWGSNARGALGTGDTTEHEGIVAVALPTDVGRAVEIEAGVAAFCVRTESDRVLCWGDGMTTSLPVVMATPVRAVDEATIAVGGSSEARRIALGRNHGAALAEGAPLVWGSDAEGQLALGAAAVGTTVAARPSNAIPGPSTIVRELAIGSRYTCARLDDGMLACAGSNGYGQLGVPVAQPNEPDWQRYCPCVGCTP